MNEIKHPEWEFWRDHRVIKLMTAVLLSLDAEPRQFDDENPYFDFPGYKQRSKLAHMAAMAGRFGKPPDKPAGWIGNWIGPQSTHLDVDLADFAEWCVDKHLSIPPELAVMDVRGKANPAIQSILNPDHPSFSPDLEAAVNAWLAVAIEGYGNQSDTFTRRADAWLRCNRTGLSQTARKRIATVINPLERKRKK